MIGLDTNVLVRYLTHDDPVQYAKVAAFLDAAIDRGEQFVVNTAVLCELVWCLEPRTIIHESRLHERSTRYSHRPVRRLNDLDQARQALEDFRTTKADYSDALIGRINRSLGAEHTVTLRSCPEGGRDVSAAVIPGKNLFVRPHIADGRGGSPTCVAGRTDCQRTLRHSSRRRPVSGL